MAKRKLDKSVIKEVSGGYREGFVRQLPDGTLMIVDKNGEDLFGWTFEDIDSAIKMAVLYQVTLPDFMTDDRGVPIAPTTEFLNPI